MINSFTLSYNHLTFIEFLLLFNDTESSVRNYIFFYLRDKGGNQIYMGVTWISKETQKNLILSSILNQP